MKILKKLFSRRLKEEGPKDVMRITRVIGPLIDKTAEEIFITYKTRLLSEPITYIVPAVGGQRRMVSLKIPRRRLTQRSFPS